ncbi:MAG: Crp/Fnr family transcriptional regulator [Dehalobacter sp. 4CP]|uniref:Crp/Fnr family transcriptional regulator n=1 Tax=Dehalobacter sp. CP TaxID=2594474 RepID=UPI0003A79669|nr:Crp/Fnr family transcriptional regulator [Dehalobacter sp.]NBJ14385.1 Crp/Fnr family transcriptional regulator [Dehalobacter sp. 4CP]
MTDINRDYCIVPDNFYPVKSLQKYVHMGVVRKYRKGDTISFPGEVLDRVIYVVSGKVSVYFLEDNKQKLMYYACRYCPIDGAFGFKIGLIHVVSEENSTVCFFSKEQLFEIFRQDDEAHLEFLSNFACKCGFFMYVSKEMDLYTPTARVLRMIYELCLTKGKVVDNIYEIDIKLTQKTISEITGVHFVSVCRIFGWLKKEKIVHKTPNKIIIYDLPRLKDMINLNNKH